MNAALACAIASAAACGFCVSVTVSGELDTRARRRRARSGMGRVGESAPDSAVTLEGGSPVLSFLRRQGRAVPDAHLTSLAAARVWGVGLGDAQTLIARAGLAEGVSPEAVRVVRMQATFALSAFGLLCGSIFTGALAAALGVAGAIAGFVCVPMALRSEAAVRNAQMERNLSQMVEVVVLGLRSGLSFERSFSLYPRYFDTGLARSMTRISRQWETGLSSREDALRCLEAEYDSQLLSRVVGSMVRSLRFGSSIADSLEAVAVEAREVHRARMEERVAKVAVKMMLPVGALILPAMLLLVMGPVLLELVEGL